MKETDCCIGKNKLQFLRSLTYFQTVFLFACSVLLVLLLPNVGTRLHEATSPSLVVRRTLVLSHNHNHGLKMCLLLKSTYCLFCSAEPVRPIDPAAWISHTTALTGPYPHYGKNNQPPPPSHSMKHPFCGNYNNITSFKQ